MNELKGSCHTLKVHVVGAGQPLPEHGQGERLEVPDRHAETIGFLIGYVTIRLLGKAGSLMTLEIPTRLFETTPFTTATPVEDVIDALVRYAREEDGEVRTQTLNLIVPLDKVQDFELVLKEAQQKNPS